MTIIRAFIGIDFTEDIKKYVLEIQKKLGKYASRGRWKHSDNFHLTLKFLDEISIEQQDQINHIMRNICCEEKPFSLVISGLGAFNGRESLRVVWLGVNGDIPVLNALYNKIEIALSQIGFPPEKRRYTPHITIGQDILFFCSLDDLRRFIGEVHFSPAKVESLFLFKSEQTKNKRIYTKVSGYELCK